MSGCRGQRPAVDTALLVCGTQAPTCGQCGKQYEPVLVALWLKACRPDVQCTYCHACWRELMWHPRPDVRWAVPASIPRAS